MTQTQYEHLSIESNGVVLHVVAAGPADGELVILLHGFPEFWYGWKAQIDFLAAQGYRVLAPDQRGYNLSEKPRGVESYLLDTLAADVVGLIDAQGRDQVYLVGHDWGAAVAWHTAIRHPARIKKLAILNVPHPKVFMRNVRGNPAQMLKSWYIGFFQIPLLPEALLTFGDAQGAAQMLLLSSAKGTFTDADLREYTRAWQQPGAMTGMLNWYRAIVQYPPALPADPRITMPTLILWGVQDVALERSMAAQSAELCDDVRVVYYEEASHWVQHEQAHSVNAELDQFFGGAHA